MVRYPNWFEDWFYSQMTTEIRTSKGWENPGKRRNETWDLAYYALGLAQRPADQTCPLANIRIDRIDWDGDVPSWADEWDANDLVFGGKEEPRFSPKRTRPSLEDLAKNLA